MTTTLTTVVDAVRDVRRAAPAAERGGSLEIVLEALDVARQARLGAARLPSAVGGFDASLGETLDALASIAETDAVVALGLREHLAWVELLLESPAVVADAHWLGEVGRGALFATVVPRDDAGEAPAVADEGGRLRLRGFGRSGIEAERADWLIVPTAGSEGHEGGVVVIPGDRSEVRFVDGDAAACTLRRHRSYQEFRAVAVHGAERVTLDRDARARLAEAVELLSLAIASGCLADVQARIAADDSWSNVPAVARRVLRAVHAVVEGAQSLSGAVRVTTDAIVELRAGTDGRPDLRSRVDWIDDLVASRKDAVPRCGHVREVVGG